MKAYHIALIVFGVGLVGGLANALLSGNTFLLPKKDAGPPKDVLMPGLLATMFVGGIAAVVSWGLYGANAGDSIDGNASIKVAALAGALVIGFGGARWLTNEVDKSLLSKSTAIAAGASKSEATAQSVLHATPMETLKILRTEK